MNDPIPLATITDGEYTITTYTVALLIGIHADDITNDIDPSTWPHKWLQRFYQRGNEAVAHGAEQNILSIATYFAKKEHNAHIWTDTDGTTWMQTPSPPTAPTSENTPLRQV